MIFLSHTHKDKAVVEQVALRLRDTFGQDDLFYDSWAMQPGDGIIDKMNVALGKCRLFLFFVSKNSLQSNMVQLEWQNALVKATGGQCRIVPVKLDDCFMPPILLQSLYIDLFGQGLEIALRQIVDVISGRNTFTAGPQQFSNLRAFVYEENGITLVECRAEHFMEPKSHFLLLLNNEEGELSFNCRHTGMYHSGFNKGIKLDNGKVINAQIMKVESGTTPGFPFVIEVTPNAGVQVLLDGVLHEKRQNHWEPIPLYKGKPINHSVQ